MIRRDDHTVHMIPVDEITVLNPRLRGKTKFKEIVENIRKLGLKRPITVARNDDPGGTAFVLVCGQGRLEAFQALGEPEIPCIIITGSQEDFLLVSLAENLARRRQSAGDLVNEIRVLIDRGYRADEIARKIDLAISYVRGIAQLIKKGETRLVRAVHAKQIPLTVAISIARSDDKQIQAVLTEAYEKKELRGKQLLAARRLIERRRLDGRSGRRANGAPKTAKKKVSRNELLQTYQKETSRQRMVIQKAKICETRLLFVVAALRQLLNDENFANLLRAESLDSLPQYLSEQVGNVEVLP